MKFNRCATDQIKYGCIKYRPFLTLFIVMCAVLSIGSAEVAYAGPDEGDPVPDPAAQADPEGLIEKYINPAIAFLAAVVGLVTVISIVVGGIQYASSGDDPQKVQKAKARIINSILGLLAFFFLFAFLEWIIPGGLIDG